MSASRPAKGRIIPKKVVHPPQAVGTLSKAKPKAGPAIPRVIENGSRPAKLSVASKIQAMHDAPRTAHTDRGKAKASAPPSITTISSDEDEDEDEEDDLEEVPIPEAGPSTPAPGTPTTPGTNLTRATGTPGTIGTATTAPSEDEGYGGYDDEDEEEEGDGAGEKLTLKLDGETPEQRARRIALALRKKPMTSKDRAIRLEVHKFHVLALLASARIRNKWCCHALLKARLLSLLPHPLHTAFNIPPSRFPDRAQRSRLFFDALQSLVTWWSQSFFDISDTTLGLRTRPWDEVQEVADKLPKLTRGDFYPNSFEAPSDWTGASDLLEEGSGGEKLRSVNSLMKKALQQEGSRDVSAQLFVALARSLGLGTRLVVSLQPAPWRAEKIVPKKKSGAGKGGKSIASRQGNGETEESEEDLEEVPIPEQGGPNGAPGEVVQKMKQKPIRAAGRRRHHDPADVYRLKKPAVQKVGTAPKPKKKKEDLSHQPPVFWAEVFSRSDQRWIPVDPVLGLIRKKAHYEPSSDSGPIRMLYVVAFEEDGYARDVTLRYTKNFGAKTIKLRPPARKDEPDWWATVIGFLERPYRLNRDELEDAELETSQVSEGMPMHMNGFKDHPIYVLERHLKREEVIQPKKEIGRFRGEPVFRRANVHQCKTAENWMRSGRKVKSREEPMKWVKQRAVTLQKRRAQELSMQESGEAIQQGLYAEWQTDVYRPPPIKDGKIPQNSFGNIDLYAPTMLPEGAVHLPYKGIAKVAKSLQISYAEACTGFEFKKQRAIPVITGIVVAAENEAMVMDAYEESAAATEERERAKKVERALKRWAKLVNGLRVRARLQAEYGTGDNLQQDSHNPLADAPDGRAGAPGKPNKSAAAVIASANQEAGEGWASRIRERSPSEELEEVKGTNETAPEPEDGRAIAATAAGEPGSDDIEKVADMNGDDGPEPAADMPPAKSRTSPSAPKRTVIRIPRQNVPLPAPTPKRPTRSVRSSKHQAASPVESDAQTSGSDIPPPPSRKRKQKTAAPPPRAASTRTLRSRTSKTQEQLQQEQDAKERIRQALASDEEMTDASD